MAVVIAGNVGEFHSRYDHRFKYLANLPEDLRGRADTTLFLYGSYYKRNDFDRELIEEYCKRHDIVIIQD